MNCNCVRKINAVLAPKNLQLCVSYQIGPPMRDHIQIHTMFADARAKPRGQKPTPVLATFCPFCGTKLHNDDTPRSITSGEPITNEKEKT